MKAPVKPCFLLFCLVLGIYMMRDSNLSLSSALKAPLRMLLIDDTNRPTKTFCKSTDISQAFTPAQIERAHNLKASVQTMRNGNPLLDLLTSGNIGANVLSMYVMPTLQFIAPWPILFVVSVILFIIIGCNWCCIYGCCKETKCCKCCKAPKDSRRKGIYIAFSVLFLLAILGVSVAGIITGSQITTGIEVTICSFIATVEDLEYGVAADGWIGVGHAAESLGTVYDKFDSTVAKLGQSSSSITNINTKLSDVKSQLVSMKNAVTALPKPPRAAADHSAETYTPIYGANIGPETDETTNTGMIQKECQVRYDVLKEAQKTINDAVTTLQGPGGSGIKTALQSGKGTVDEMSNMLLDQINSVVQYGGIGKDVIKGVGSGLSGIFIANLVLSVVTVGSIVMIGCMKAKFFNKFLLSNTFVLLGLTILGFLVSTVFYPLSLILMETCDVLDKVQITTPKGSVEVATSQETLRQIMTTVAGSNIAGIMEVCIFDKNNDGADMMTYFDLKTALKSFDDIFTQFSLIENGKGGTGGMTIQDAPPASFVITAQTNAIADFGSGMQADSPDTVTDLNALNNVVNRNVNGCTSLYDTWQLAAGKCENSMGNSLAASDVDTYNRGNPTCIGFDNWAASPPAKSSTNRYTLTEIPASCNTQGGNALLYAQNSVNGFKNNRDKVKQYFVSAKTELDKVNTKYNDFATAIQAVLKDFTVVKTALQDVRDSLYGTPKSLLTNLKCKFLGKSLRTMTDALCIGFVGSIYQSSVVIIVSSVLTFFGAIFVFCLGKRFILDAPGANAKPI